MLNLSSAFSVKMLFHGNMNHGKKNTEPFHKIFACAPPTHPVAERRNMNFRFISIDMWYIYWDFS